MKGSARGRFAPTVVDLFCGAGGVSLGLQTAGFEVVAAFDNWTPAVETYSKNLGGHVVQENLTDESRIEKGTVVVGGPPCQGFSSAGMRREADERNSLVGLFAATVCRLRPAAFVFENVEGFLTGGGGRFVFELLCPLLQSGYRIHLRKVNAANYGVPQHRKRVIGIGGLGWDPSFPEPTHVAYGAPGAHLVQGDFPRTPNVDETLAGLPEPEPRDRLNGDMHAFRPLQGEDLERARLLKPGQRMKDLPEELWHESYRKRAFRRVKDGTPTERRGGAPSGIRRLHGDEPSKAITGGALNEFLHPTENRLLTLAECARLQTFPDAYVFCGSRAERVQLIGNAVPPLLSERIGRALFADLKHGPPKRAFRQGRLLSFVPTLSNGASPALRAVTEAVVERFGVGEYQQQSFIWS